MSMTTSECHSTGQRRCALEYCDSADPDVSTTINGQARSQRGRVGAVGQPPLTGAKRSICLQLFER